MINSLTGDKSSTRSTSSTLCNSISALNDNSTIENEAANNPNDNNPDEIDGYTTKSSIGRPKGSTSSFYMDLNERIELATREAGNRLEAEQRKSRSRKFDHLKAYWIL
jgi:hypothetical protein